MVEGTPQALNGQYSPQENLYAWYFIHDIPLGWVLESGFSSINLAKMHISFYIFPIFMLGALFGARATGSPIGLCVQRVVRTLLRTMPGSRPPPPRPMPQLYPTLQKKEGHYTNMVQMGYWNRSVPGCTKSYGLCDGDQPLEI